MTQNKLTTFFLLMALLMAGLILAACDGEPDIPPTPILPPPNVSVDQDATATAVANATTAGLETAEPGISTTGEPTPTLEPTATASVTPDATPVTDPPIRAVNAANLPATGRDLLFIADGAFKRWNHQNRQIETLVPGPDPASRVRDPESLVRDFVGDVTDFSVSADGKRAVVARLTASRPISETMPETGGERVVLHHEHELLFMDLVSRETWTIVPQVDNLEAPALSPDAQQVIFFGSGMDGTMATSPEEPLPLQAYVLPTGGGNPGTLRQIYTCQPTCFDPAWHPDSNLVVFADREAMWLFNLAAQEAEILLQNRPFGERAETPEQVTVYSPISWASNGRYLLTFKGAWEGGSRAVLDVPTGQLIDVPDTFVYADFFPTQVMWMPDDRLFVLRSNEASGPLQPQAELWRIQLEADDIVREEFRSLSDEQVGALGQQYLEDGRFAYALTAVEGPNPDAGLYILTSLNEEPERVNAVPAFPDLPLSTRVYWAADGLGALIDYGDRTYYGPTDGDFLYDVQTALGQEPHAFHWQPEIIVP